MDNIEKILVVRNSLQDINQDVKRLTAESKLTNSTENNTTNLLSSEKIDDIVDDGKDDTANKARFD